MSEKEFLHPEGDGEEREEGGEENSAPLKPGSSCYSEVGKAGRVLSRALLTVALVALIVLVLALVLAASLAAGLAMRQARVELPSDPYQRALVLLNEFPVIDG